MNINEVRLAGRMTRDPQVKYLPSQTPVCEWGMAINSKYRTKDGEDREEATFVDCVAFGRVAETIGKHFQKGKEIYVSGKLRFDSWEDKQSGGKRSKLSVVVENFQFIGGRDSGESKPERQRQQDGPSVPPDTERDIPF